MSCVISVCYSDYCIIMGDGRFLSLKYNPPRVDTEFFEKVIKLNSFVCMGFTGDPMPVLTAYFDLKSRIAEDMRLENVLDLFIEHIIDQDSERGSIQMIFSGKALSGKYETRQVQILRDNTISQKHYPTDRSIAVVYSPPIGTDISSIVDKNLSQKLSMIKNIHEIKNLIGACITKTAEINPTVNKVLFFVEASDRINDECRTFRFVI